MFSSIEFHVQLQLVLLDLTVCLRSHCCDGWKTAHCRRVVQTPPSNWRSWKTRRIAKGTHRNPRCEYRWPCCYQWSKPFTCPVPCSFCSERTQTLRWLWRKHWQLLRWILWRLLRCVAFARRNLGWKSTYPIVHSVRTEIDSMQVLSHGALSFEEAVTTRRCYATERAHTHPELANTSTNCYRAFT